MSSKPLSESLCKEMLSRPEDFRIQERIPLVGAGVTWPFRLDEPEGVEHPFLIIHATTNHRGPAASVIIELAAVRGFYCSSKHAITRIENVYHSLNDPGAPLEWPFPEVLGFSDSMLKGQRIDMVLLESWLSEDPLIISIDRAEDIRAPFERLFNQHSGLEWACYENDIRWSDYGRENCMISGHLLEDGWFYDDETFIAPVADCLAFAWLLHQIPQAFEGLLQKVSRGVVRISVPNTGRGLARRGYHDFYRGEYQEYIVKECDALYKDTELNWLNKQGISTSKTNVQHVSARERFKDN